MTISKGSRQPHHSDDEITTLRQDSASKHILSSQEKLTRSLSQHTSCEGIVYQTWTMASMYEETKKPSKTAQVSPRPLSPMSSSPVAQTVAASASASTPSPLSQFSAADNTCGPSKSRHFYFVVMSVNSSTLHNDAAAKNSPRASPAPFNPVEHILEHTEDT
ncbi:hypothetical protein D9619_000010 [Psilocybe cf. subviscida]|uniref:Uncharacterized protein n=1 Tax=Psilocybe cf. subviscida TaxID=2480587 RepID=A0A8H5BF35_9AGAR|nr:hypothetical protein D9619_000010 [Psilocybe cf. subviscida]